MNPKVKKITRSALFSAIAVIFLYIASVFPTGQLGFTALASFSGIAAVIECGIPGGIAVYVCGSLLGFLTAPDKTPVYIFMLFFGYYPILKSVAERQKSRVLEWIIKIVLFAAAAFVALRILSLLTVPDMLSGLGIVPIMILLTGIYVVFDIGISKLIFFYMSRVSRNIRK